jgi:hypothetical protein
VDKALLNVLLIVSDDLEAIGIGELDATSLGEKGVWVWVGDRCAKEGFCEGKTMPDSVRGGVRVWLRLVGVFL